MKLIHFTNDIPAGFEQYSLIVCNDIGTILPLLTKTYMNNNYPELSIEDGEYEMKRATRNYSGESTFILDQFNCYGKYTFDIIDVDYLKG